jgi:hypothetical protein
MLLARSINPNIGVIEILDERLAALRSIIKTEEFIPETIEIVDIADLVTGANRAKCPVTNLWRIFGTSMRFFTPCAAFKLAILFTILRVLIRFAISRSSKHT